MATGLGINPRPEQWELSGITPEPSCSPHFLVYNLVELLWHFAGTYINAMAFWGNMYYDPDQLSKLCFWSSIQYTVMKNSYCTFHWHVDSKVWSNWKRILMIKNTVMTAERINLVQELRAELVAWFRIKWEIKACIQQYSVPKPNTMIAPVKCVGKEFVSYKRTIAIYIITLSVIERVLGRLRNACLHKHQAPFFCDNYFIVFIFLKYPSRPGP